MAETLAGGRYEVLRRLATGGMGEVLLAEYRGDNEISPGLLVVKRVLAAAPGQAPNETQVKMLREEARLGQRLMHGNLVETFRFEEHDPENPLLVIELLAGRSMAQVLGQAKKRRENVPVDVALGVLRGSCCGLHFAHTLKDRFGKSLGLVHRDVSPANIFVTFDGRVKVIDFGVAKSADSEIKTATGILKGKLGYMSPEQSLGAAKLTAQADVWSLGVFFWEMLVAERLFSSPNPTATLLQISQKPIPRPSTLRPDIPAHVEAICMRMLDREPSTRFQSCAEVARAIDALPGGGGVSRVDVGAFLAGRFPEEAEAGARDAARCARRMARGPIPTGLVDGGSWNEMIAEDDDQPATAILSADQRAALLAQAIADDGAGSIGEDDVATVRVSADVVAEAMREVAAMKQRQPTHVGRVAADEDLIATAAVSPDVAATIAIPSPKTPPPRSPVGETSNTLRNPIAAPDATLPASPAPPSLRRPTSELPVPMRPAANEASRTMKNPAVDATDPDSRALPAPDSSLAGPMAPASAPPSVATLPVPSPAPGPWSMPDPSASQPSARPPTRPPSRTGLEVQPVTNTILPPPQQAAPMARPPSVARAPSPSPPSTTSWLSVALATFGALVFVMGVGFSFAIHRPTPRVLQVYADPAGFDVVVAAADHVPVGAVARPLDVTQPLLKRAADAAAVPVAADVLRAQLEQSGVWARASMPSTSRATTAALLPVVIAALGLLALAFALPGFLAGGGMRWGLCAAAVVVVGALTALVVMNGALSWPGRKALAEQPKLEWR